MLHAYKAHSGLRQGAASHRVRPWQTRLEYVFQFLVEFHTVECQARCRRSFRRLPQPNRGKEGEVLAPCGLRVLCRQARPRHHAARLGEHLVSAGTGVTMKPPGTRAIGCCGAAQVTYPGFGALCNPTNRTLTGVPKRRVRLPAGPAAVGPSLCQPSLPMAAPRARSSLTR